MMAITTRSSISVNPLCDFDFIVKPDTFPGMRSQASTQKRQAAVTIVSQIPRQCGNAEILRMLRSTSAIGGGFSATMA